MKKASFIMYQDHKEIFDMLTDEEAGKLIKAIFEYDLTQTMTLVDRPLQIAFTPIKTIMDKNRIEYRNTCEKRAIAGSKGGKQKVANASKCYQKVANVAEYDNEYDNDKEKENILKEKWQIQFESFWELYPRKVKKAVTQEWFKKKKVSDETFEQMIDSLKKHKKTKKWQADNGEYVPHPTTWLNQKRWEDSIDESEEIEEQKTNAIFYDGAIQIL